MAFHAMVCACCIPPSSLLTPQNEAVPGVVIAPPPSFSPPVYRQLALLICLFLVCPSIPLTWTFGLTLGRKDSCLSVDSRDIHLLSTLLLTLGSNSV